MMDWTFRAADAAIVAATLSGPVLAVQAQKWLERDRAITERRRQIFRTLMATRATNLSVAHVEALNAVPVEFYGPRKSSLKAVTDDWHAYLDHLDTTATAPESWAQRRKDLLVDLLFGMSRLVGYNFSKSEIGKDIYHPKGHVEVENEQTIIRRGFAKLLNGEISIPMAVKEFPFSMEAVEGQEALRKLIVEWLEGSRVVKVEQQ